MPHRVRGALAAAVLTLLALQPMSAAVTLDPAGRTWYVVRYEQRIGSADRTSLEALSAAPLLYRPADSYLAFLTPRTARAVGTHPNVASVSRLQVEDKISSSLSAGSGNELTVITSGTADRAAIGRLGTIIDRYDFSADGSLAAVDIRLDRALVDAVATRRSVLWIGPASPGAFPEDEGSAQIVAGKLASNVPVPGYDAFLQQIGLDGSGVKVTIADDGIDPTHPEMQGRIARRINYGPVGAYPAEGHGTHVAGIVGGSGVAVPGIGRIKDSAGFHYGIGIAPKVSFVDQNVIELVNSQVNPPRVGANLRAWVRDGVREGSIGWNASWHSGEGTGAGYIANAALLDELVRDGDSDTAGSQPFVMVFSSGNAGGGASTITSPKEAKNIITVGNSFGHRAGNIDTISSSSSRGPAKDGRILPTVAAPGTNIVSARAAMGALCTTSPPSDSFTLYSSCSGTSMAAPHVTGVVALITQWWRASHAGANPSPALAKALIINTATDTGAANIPNGAEGWGRVNIGTLFAPDATRVYVDQERVFSDPGESLTLPIAPADPSRPLKVSLVWTDAPGAPGASPALVNDLDLTLTASDGTVFRGNVFSGGKSVSGGALDRRNNLENIFVAAPTGAYTLDVSAFDLPGDGVPGFGDTTDQDFALVVSNAIVTN